MSSQDVLSYFNMISTFYQQMVEIQTDGPNSSFFVGWPTDPQTGKGAKGPNYQASMSFLIDSFR